MKSNTKIIIAIVAMFVIALSIVGFTYAYFTANVGTNSAQYSVNVNAGLLKVNYASTQTIEITNIVPGWVSDAKMIYHPVESVNEAGQISAISIDDTTDNTYDGNAVEPVQFTVENTGDSTNNAYYAIELVDITNGIATNNSTDADNLTVSLYEGEWTGTISGTPLKSETLAASGTQKMSAVIEIEPEGVDNYYLVVSYANNENADQNKSMGQTIKASVEIVGLNKTSDNSYVDEAGATYTPAS